jgi:Fe-S cluster assembly protein SufD
VSADERERWLELAGELAARRRDEPAFLHTLRREARERFAEVGFPSTRLEEWRYTDVSPLAGARFSPPGPGHPPISRDALEAVASPLFACSLFVFVDGCYEPALSTPLTQSRGARVESLAHAWSRRPDLVEAHLGRLASPKEHPFVALGTALLEDGALVHAPAGAATDPPLHLVFLTSERDPGPAIAPRVLVVAEEGSHVTLVQDHVTVGGGRGFTNSITEVVCAPNSRVDLVLVQRESDASFHVSNLAARLERDARLATHTLTLGGRLVRNDLSVLLADEGADCTLHGLFLGHDTEVLDNHTLVDHAMPHGTSRELYKGILAGRARGVFRGRVIVRPDAQKTDARQSNANVLLSDGAEIDTKPQLEIHADDVKCSHGSSIGRLDEEALFYLRSRGMAEAHARDLLLRGFAAEVLASLPAPPLGERIADLLLERLNAMEVRP